jgi:hypothetical protein
VPIYYSLGNLVNPFSTAPLCRPFVARIELEKGTLPGGEARTYVKKAQAIEVRQVADEQNKRISLQLQAPAG